MHSSELPVTEWWDPEWDVYEVPSSPYDAQEVGETTADLPEAVFDAWFEAYDHNATVEHIMTGERWGWPDRLYAHQLTQHAYPGQPATRTKPPTKPCTCEYRLRRNEVAPLHGPYVKCDDFTSRLFHDCWWRWSFRINPTCPHHAPQPSIEALWNDPALNVMRDPYDLDDNERTDR